MKSQQKRDLIIVTGMSGAGRSTVANALEDLGWYVVDNLPPQMLRPLIEISEHAGDKLPRLAAVVDVRGRDFFPELKQIIHDLRQGTHLRIIFLDASDDTLVRRFESVRRPHPLQDGGTIIDGITAEREALSTMREISDTVLDTSHLNVHALSKKVAEDFRLSHEDNLELVVMSFGFKYGIPSDADLVVDARFLPNPFWEDELKFLNGEDIKVSNFVLAQAHAQTFTARYLEALVPVFEGYRHENKRNITLAIGCTGGKHRSVALARFFREKLSTQLGLHVTVKHRDLGKE